MCLAIPGKIIEIDPKTQHAIIDFGDNTKRKANISLVNAKVGQYVLVHAGFAIQIIDPRDAKETLELFKTMLSDKET